MTPLRAGQPDEPRRPFRLLIDGHLNSPPPAVPVEVEFGVHSWHGPRRVVNDDQYLVLRFGRHQETLLTSLTQAEVPQRFDESAFAMVIADGLGQAGERASRLAVATLAELAISFGEWNVRIDEPTAERVMHRAEAFYKDVDLALAQARMEGVSKLETAMTAVYTAGNELFFAHVGHSRAYLYRDGTLLRLTRDHTLGESRTGTASQDLGDTARDLRHVLTGTLGRAGAPPRIDIERFGLLDHDIVLLCTNGLTDVVDDTRIVRELQQPRTPDEHCRALVDTAVSSHAGDDVTVLMGRYSIPE